MIQLLSNRRIIVHLLSLTHLLRTCIGKLSLFQLCLVHLRHGLRGDLLAVFGSLSGLFTLLSELNDAGILGHGKLVFIFHDSWCLTLVAKDHLQVPVILGIVRVEDLALLGPNDSATLNVLAHDFKEWDLAGAIKEPGLRIKDVDCEILLLQVFG